MNSSKKGASIKAVFIALVIGAFLGAAATYKILEKQSGAKNGSAPARSGGHSSVDPGGASRSDDYISRKLREWNLDPDELRHELDRAGSILRDKGRELGAQVADNTSDIRIIAVIKARFTLDRELSGWGISVGCKDGHVALTGNVESPEQIGRAIVLALDTDGVVDVDSSLHVKPRTSKNDTDDGR